MNLVNNFFSNSQVPPDFLAKKIQKAPKESSFLRDVSGPISPNILHGAMGLAVYGLIQHLQASVSDRGEIRSFADCIVFIADSMVASLFTIGLVTISTLYETEAKLNFIEQKALFVSPNMNG